MEDDYIGFYEWCQQGSDVKLQFQQLASALAEGQAFVSRQHTMAGRRRWQLRRPAGDDDAITAYESDMEDAVENLPLARCSWDAPREQGGLMWVWVLVG